MKKLLLTLIMVNISQYSLSMVSDKLAQEWEELREEGQRLGEERDALMRKFEERLNGLIRYMQEGQETSFDTPEVVSRRRAEDRELKEEESELAKKIEEHQKRLLEHKNQLKTWHAQKEEPDEGEESETEFELDPESDTEPDTGSEEDYE